MVSVVTLAVRLPSAPAEGVTAADAVDVGQVDVGEGDRPGIGEIADRRDQLGHRPGDIGRSHDRRIVGAR